MSESTSQSEKASSSRKRRRLNNTNMYYAQYAEGYESEPGYDSDSARAARVVHGTDPRFKKFRKLCRQEEREKELHRNWIDQLEQDPELEEKTEQYTEMSVKLRDKRIRFKRHLEIEGRRLKYFYVRITIVYKDYLRKWAFDQVHSHLPDAVTFPDGIVFFREPLADEILDIVVEMRDTALDYMKKAYYFEYFMFKVENDYRDVKINLKRDFTHMEIEITDNAWPGGLWRTFFSDTLTVYLDFDENCNVVESSFKFKYARRQDFNTDKERRNTKIVRKNLADVKSTSLENTFEKLMGEKLVGNRYKFKDLSYYREFLDS